MLEVLSKREELKGPIPQAILGGGYSSDRQMPTVTPCLKDGNVTFSGGSKSVVSIGESVSFEEISKTLNVDVESGLNIGVFSTDVSAQYARYVKDNTFSSAFYFYSAIDLPTMIWNPASYGPSVLNAYGSGVYQSGIQNFRDNCGDKFIQQEHPGGVLTATLKVDFNSKYDKSVFIEHSSSSFLGMTVASSTIEKISVTYDLHGSLELSAMQIGGNAGELANIFNASAAGYYISHCEIQDVSACNKLIDSILDYSSNNFVNQLNYTGGTITGDAASMSYTYGYYTDIGLNASQTIITPEIQNAITNLTDLYNINSYIENRAGHILYSGVMKSSTNENAFYWDPADIANNTKADLQSNYKNATSNLDILTSSDPTVGAIGCYADPANCITLSNNINSQIQSTSNSTFSPFNNAYLYGFPKESITENTNCSTYFLPLGKGVFSLMSPNDFTPAGWCMPQTLAPIKIIQTVDSFITKWFMQEGDYCVDTPIFYTVEGILNPLSDHECAEHVGKVVFGEEGDKMHATYMTCAENMFNVGNIPVQHCVLSDVEGFF